MQQKTNLNISLPEPCSEDWNQMTPAEKGRFCGSCEKIVVDFTQMSDDALIEFFVTQKQRACGRFNADQLNRAITPAPQARRNYTAAIALAGTLSVLSTTAACQTEEIGKAILTGDTIIQTHHMGEVDPSFDMDIDSNKVDTVGSVEGTKEPAIETIVLPEVIQLSGVPMIYIEPVEEPRWKRFIPFRKRR
ncbi:MAG: hypothetical protein HQ500_12465 [Flavobacteriales bacterium]|nr:hypothetical protein [Flavobacteriales bacterium]